jgi:hypothetical protein
VDVVESIADRRIRAAREAGLFDNLPGAGKPLPDLDRERPPGWWAVRLVKRERSIARAEVLDRELRAAMPQLWRLDAVEELRARIDELNDRIDAYNRATTWERRSRLDADSFVARWRRLRP